MTARQETSLLTVACATSTRVAAQKERLRLPGLLVTPLPSRPTSVHTCIVSANLSWWAMPHATAFFAQYARAYENQLDDVTPSQKWRSHWNITDKRADSEYFRPILPLLKENNGGK